jgi:hypothetical protein
MDLHSDAVIEECINKLQGLLGGAKTTGQSSGAHPKAVSIPQFDHEFAKCLDKAKSIGPELTKLVFEGILRRLSMVRLRKL